MILRVPTYLIIHIFNIRFTERFSGSRRYIVKLSCFSVVTSALGATSFKFRYRWCALAIRWRDGREPQSQKSLSVYAIREIRQVINVAVRSSTTLRVNDLAAPTVLNSMSHFRHMQFLSLSSWRYTRPEKRAINFLYCDTSRISARVRFSAPRI